MSNEEKILEELSNIRQEIMLIKNTLDLGVPSKDEMHDHLSRVYKRVNGLVITLIGIVAVQGGVLGYMLTQLAK